MADFERNEPHGDDCGAGFALRGSSCRNPAIAKGSGVNLTQEERELLGTLADLLIPAGSGFPSASQAGVAHAGVDQLLAARPDLLRPLKGLLIEAKGKAPAEFLKDLQANDAMGFGVLAEVVPGAYFLNAEVRTKLKYDGQSGRPIELREDYLEDGLLQSVIDRGPIYRPTP